MPYDNPYEPPSIPAGMLEPEWPTDGVFRDGDLLVVKAGTPLPPLCVRTGLPAEESISVTLPCRGANDHSLPTSSFWSGTSVTLEIPINSRWRAKQKWRMKIAQALLFLGFTFLCFVFIYLFFVLSVNKQGRGELLGLLAIICLVVGGILQDTCKPLSFILTISRGFLWIGGADRRFLQQLPEWPAPKLTYWQRFWV